MVDHMPGFQKVVGLKTKSWDAKIMQEVTVEGTYEPWAAVVAQPYSTRLIIKRSLV